MRLGAVSKGAVLEGAITTAEVIDYLRVRAGTTVTIEADSAISYAEKWTAQAIERAEYTVTYAAAKAGDAILLPRWHDMTTTEAGFGIDAMAGVVTLPDEPSATGTFAFEAGWGGDCPADLRSAILYLASSFYRFRGMGVEPDKFPPAVTDVLDTYELVADVPVWVTDWDAETGDYQRGSTDPAVSYSDLTRWLGY